MTIGKTQEYIILGSKRENSKKKKKKRKKIILWVIFFLNKSLSKKSWQKNGEFNVYSHDWQTTC